VYYQVNFGDKMKKQSKDLRKVEKREKTFATDAKQEGKGAAQRAKSEAKEGLPKSAADSRWETKVDNKFAKIRSDKVAALKRGK
jgi:hypothetical protein